MPIVYKIDVLKSLKEAGYSTAVLRKDKIIGEATIQRLRHKQTVSFDVLSKLCYLLGCEIGDILVYVPEGSEIAIEKSGLVEITKYPSEAKVNKAISNNEPLLLLVSFDGETAIISHIDDAVEHNILLEKTGYKSTDIDKFFRIVLDKDGADWIFVCPSDYKHYKNPKRRIEQFYKDGFKAISGVLCKLGYIGGINIPERYKRCLDTLW